MKILMVIAKDGFKDVEYQFPYEVFQKNNIHVDVASTEKGDCFGSDGMVITADMAFSDVVVEEYFAIVLIGGPGSHSLVGNEKLEAIIKKADKDKIVIGAICYAPVILAKAGILNGKNATVWDSDKKQSPILAENGATYLADSVVADGKIVTANGPEAAKYFGEMVVKIAECEKCWIK